MRASALAAAWLVIATAADYGVPSHHTSERERASRRNGAGRPGLPASDAVGVPAGAKPLGAWIDPALFAEFQWRKIAAPSESIGAPGIQSAAPASSQIAIDTAFPYRICGLLPAHGAVCVASRGDRGRITAREWSPIGRGAAAALAIDPADADVIFASAGRVTRFDRRTGQQQDVSPPLAADSRGSAHGPLAYSPLDPKTLFYGAQTIWKTSTGGQTWTDIGGLSSSHEAVSALAPFYVDSRGIWTGTGDGLLQVTRDGGANWADVTPADRPPSSAVSQIEPSHFDPGGAYVVMGSTGAGASRLLRTRNGGADWIDIGGTVGAAVHAIREDPFRRGLLFAGTDRGVVVSFDDGESWQPLRLNMPETAVRGLAVKDADVVASTDDGFWVLDDASPLRQITPDVARAEAFLFRPATAWRYRGGAAGGSGAPSGPDGVVISYLVGVRPGSDQGQTGVRPGSDQGQTRVRPGSDPGLTLEIIDSSTGETIRRFSSDDATGLAISPGLHRLVWDVRYAPPPAAGASVVPRGMFVQPGTYQVRLTAGARVLRQPVVVRLDPRVRTSAADLALQFKLSKAVDEALRQVASSRAAAEGRGDAAAVARLDAAAEALLAAFETLQSADARPTDAAQTAAASAIEAARNAIGG